MWQFQEEARNFGARKQVETAQARQLAALQLACGIDLSVVFDGPAELRSKVMGRIERERLRGARQHWSYDLNRHIALKQILDKLRALAGKCADGRAQPRTGNTKPNGARRRR